MPERPRVIVFDLVETLVSGEPLRERIREIGLPGHALELWMAATLRDGFGLAASEGYASWEHVAESALEVVIAQHGIAPREDLIRHVQDGWQALPPYPDATPALDAAREAGVDVMTCSNVSRGTSDAILRHSHLDGIISRALTVDEVGRWKPAVEPYLKAVEESGAGIGGTAMVAVHGWDIMGAKSAGLTTGYCTRLEKHFPRALGTPDVTADTLDGVVRGLLELPAAREPTAR